ncbi:MAG TPA: DUF4040 domain-containing protein [bacterium]|mgnify:CR=1 FL=1|nr:DUF4040 domain-containing protein [bacterium]HOL47540.1 DUF4040 domain-containing protein [bacterium]HPQ19108.1 DUF4040 domain-containing protein [bacterium]
MEIILISLLAFMIIGAIIAIETYDLLSSVISLGAIGFALCIVFLFLGAPDIAIVQLIVEILSLVVLLKLILKREDKDDTVNYNNFSIFSVIFFTGIFITLAYFFLKEIHKFGNIFQTFNKGEIYSYYISNALEKIKAPNIVSAIILDFRGYDTLGEATVIFTAILGGLVLLRKIGRKKDETK